MFLLQYDFKIEFFNVLMKADGTPEKDEMDNTVLSSEPVITIKTQNGGPVVSLSLSDVYAETEVYMGKQGTLKISNLPMEFNRILKGSDSIKISYKIYQFLNDFDYIAQGRILYFDERQLTSTDFEITYHLYMGGDKKYLFHEFTSKDENGIEVRKPIDVKDKTVEEAIRLGFGDRAMILLSNEEKNRVIEKSMIVKTPLELTDRLIANGYVPRMVNTLPRIESKYDSVFIFKEKQAKDMPASEYKLLDPYILFIPQKQTELSRITKYQKITWSCEVIYNHLIRVGMHVKFHDSSNKIVKCSVYSVTSNISNVGNCSMNLVLYDEVANTRPMGKE